MKALFNFYQFRAKSLHARNISFINCRYYSTKMDSKAEWQEPAEENPTTFQAIEQKLKDNKIKFKLTTHEPVKTCEEAAKVRNVSLDSGAKAMLIKDTGKKLTQANVPYYLAVMSGSKRFNSKAFKKITKCKSSRFATNEEVYEVTGCLTGAVPPFGSVFGVPTWVDRSLSKEESINFNCGLRTHSMSMQYADYFNVEAPTLQIFTDEEIELGGEIPTTGEAEAAGGN